MIFLGCSLLLSIPLALSGDTTDPGYWLMAVSGTLVISVAAYVVVTRSVDDLDEKRASIPIAVIGILMTLSGILLKLTEGA